MDVVLRFVLATAVIVALGMALGWVLDRMGVEED